MDPVARKPIRIRDSSRLFVGAVSIIAAVAIAGGLAGPVQASSHGPKKGVSWDPLRTGTSGSRSLEVSSRSRATSNSDREERAVRSGGKR
jgi:hypothetical protein